MKGRTAYNFYLPSDRRQLSWTSPLCQGKKEDFLKLHHMPKFSKNMSFKKYSFSALPLVLDKAGESGYLCLSDEGRAAMPATINSRDCDIVVVFPMCNKYDTIDVLFAKWTESRSKSHVNKRYVVAFRVSFARRLWTVCEKCRYACQTLCTSETLAPCAGLFSSVLKDLLKLS